MLHQQVAALFAWMKRVITQPLDELDRWQQAVRFAYDLGRFGARQLRHDRAAEMAAALSFRTLFGLLPVLVVATVFVRAVIGIEEFLGLIGEILAWVRLDQVKILMPDGGGAESQTLAAWLAGLIGDAATVDVTAIGWIGLFVVVYAAISLMVEIENSFNIIYRAPDGRSWTRRVPLYWFLLTVSPIMVGGISLLNGNLETGLAALGSAWFLDVIREAWTCACGWVLMFAVYSLLPNSKVEFRPAAIGAAVAVVLLEIGKRSLGAVLEKSFALSELYGSLGLIPLFMFWVYLMWFGVLFGLQVSAALQMLHGRRLKEIERTREVTGLLEPASLISVMEVIAKRFSAGSPARITDIQDEISIPRASVNEILDRLVENGLLHYVGRDAEAVTVACPLNQITASQLIDIGFQMVDEAGRAQNPFFEQLRNVQRQLASTQTLHQLVTIEATSNR